MKKTRPPAAVLEQLEAARQATRGALADAGILNLLRPFGYDTPELAAGKTLFETAFDKAETAAILGREAAEAAAYTDELWPGARRAYDKMARAARAAFARDRETLAALGLTGRALKSRSMFTVAAARLLNPARYTPPMRLKLAARGANDAQFSEARAKVAEYDHATEVLRRARHTAERAAAEQAGALQALAQWMSAFLPVARAALKPQPQLLAKLGLRRRAPRAKVRRRVSCRVIRPSGRRRGTKARTKRS